MGAERSHTTSSGSPRSSLRNRMTSAMRRASTTITLSKGTLSRQSSKQSLKESLKVDPSPAHAPSTSESSPSPVAESPAREAAAAAEETAHIGPSPLANVVTADERTPEPTPAPELAPEQVTASLEPVAASLPVKSPGAIPYKIPSSTESTCAPLLRTESVPEVVLSPESTIPPLVEDHRADYFSFSPEVVSTVASTTLKKPAPAVEAPAERPVPDADASYIHIPPDESTFAWSDGSDTEHSRARIPEPVRHPPEVSQSVSTKTSRSSMGSSFGQLLPTEHRRGRSSSIRFSDGHPSVDIVAGPASADSRKAKFPSLSAHMPEPVVEPLVETSDNSVIRESPTLVSYPLPPLEDVIGVKLASNSTYGPDERDGILSDDGDAQHKSVFPHIEYLANIPPKQQPLLPILTAIDVPLASMCHPVDPVDIMPPVSSQDIEAHERSRRYRNSIAVDYLDGDPEGTYSPSPPASHLTSSTSYPLQTVGWLECMLPDGSTYYHNRAMHVTTSIDLRDPSSLRRVSSYLKDVPFNVSSATRLPQANYEVWLQDAVIDGGPAAVCHCWIVHSLQIVTSSFAQVCDLGSPVENKLELECRYWEFIKSYPVHVSLSQDTISKAMRTLQWEHTGRFFSSSQSCGDFCFTPQECRELMDVISMYGSSATNDGSFLPVQCRAVAGVMLRVAQTRLSRIQSNGMTPQLTATSSPRSDHESDDAREAVAEYLVEKTPNHRHPSLRRGFLVAAIAVIVLPFSTLERLAGIIVLLLFFRVGSWCEVWTHE